jgi:hypothetical protein
MKKYLTRSNILPFVVFLILFSYIGITYYKLHKEKAIYVIGMCAKDDLYSDYSNIKNVDHIRKAMVEDKDFYRSFQNCEIIYNQAPKAMELKYPKD